MSSFNIAERVYFCRIFAHFICTVHFDDYQRSRCSTVLGRMRYLRCGTFPRRIFSGEWHLGCARLGLLLLSDHQLKVVSQTPHQDGQSQVFRDVHVFLWSSTQTLCYECRKVFLDEAFNLDEQETEKRIIRIKSCFRPRETCLEQTQFLERVIAGHFSINT